MSFISKSLETSFNSNTIVVEDRFDITVFSAVLEIVSVGYSLSIVKETSPVECWVFPAKSSPNSETVTRPLILDGTSHSYFQVVESVDDEAVIVTFDTRPLILISAVVNASLY